VIKLSDLCGLQWVDNVGNGKNIKNIKLKIVGVDGQEGMADGSFLNILNFNVQESESGVLGKNLEGSDVPFNTTKEADKEGLGPFLGSLGKGIVDLIAPCKVEDLKEIESAIINDKLDGYGVLCEQCAKGEQKQEEIALLFEKLYALLQEDQVEGVSFVAGGTEEPHQDKKEMKKEDLACENSSNFSQQGVGIPILTEENNNQGLSGAEMASKPAKVDVVSPKEARKELLITKDFLNNNKNNNAAESNMKPEGLLLTEVTKAPVGEKEGLNVRASFVGADHSDKAFNEAADKIFDISPLGRKRENPKEPFPTTEVVEASKVYTKPSFSRFDTQKAAAFLAESVDRVVRVFRDSRGQNKGVIQVEPPELGKVRIAVRSEHNTVHIHVTVDGAELGKLMQQAAGTLKDSFGRKGIVMGEFSVDVSGGGREQSHQQEGAGNLPGGRGYLGPEDLFEEDEVLLGRLDLYNGILYWIA